MHTPFRQFFDNLMTRQADNRAPLARLDRNSRSNVPGSHPVRVANFRGARLATSTAILWGNFSPCLQTGLQSEAEKSGPRFGKPFVLTTSGIASVSFHHWSVITARPVNVIKAGTVRTIKFPPCVRTGTAKQPSFRCELKPFGTHHRKGGSNLQGCGGRSRKEADDRPPFLFRKIKSRGAILVC